MPPLRKPASPFRYFNSSPEVIRLVVLMYVRYPLSLRNVEDLLFERGIDICHETVRLWWNRFGPLFAGDIRRQRVSRMRGFRHWRWHLDEMYVKLKGEMVYLWRAVDHEGEVLESYVTRTRDKAAALAFMKKALKRHGSPEAITTDGLRSYRAAMNELGNAGKQEVGRWANNRVENSHLPLRRRERAMQRFRQMKTLQKFASVHASVHNHFSLERQCGRKAGLVHPRTSTTDLGAGKVEPKHRLPFGEGTFNFASRGGRFVIGAEPWAFETRWSSARQGSVHRYSDAAGIEGVAIAEGVGTIGRAMGPPTSSTFNDR